MSTIQSTELRRLIATVQIEDVRLIEGSSRTRISAEEVRPSRLQVRHGANVTGGLQEGLFFVRATLHARVLFHEAEDGSEEALRFNVIHELKYRVPAGQAFSADTLNEFARTNGVFNAWPYWRHF